MTIVSAFWTSIVNMLVIKCDCGWWLVHRSDRWMVMCEQCQATANLGALRREWNGEKL